MSLMGRADKTQRYAVSSLGAVKEVMRDASQVIVNLPSAGGLGDNLI